MKILLTALLLLVWGTRADQAPWPRDARNRYVEFTGQLPWPAGTRAAAQRQALTRRWFFAHLTDIPEQEAAEKPGPYTFGRLPTRAHLRYQQGIRLSQLNYTVRLTAAPTGLRYTFSDFSFAAGEEDTSVLFDLEQALQHPNVDQEVLALFRNRMATAVSSWE
jgi:hypothetical protein